MRTAESELKAVGRGLVGVQYSVWSSDFSNFNLEYFASKLHNQINAGLNVSPLQSLIRFSKHILLKICY